MSTHDSHPTAHSSAHAAPPRPIVRWVVPGVALAAGVGYLIAGVAGDNVGFGVFGLGLMLVFAGVVVLMGRRSETVAGLVERNDERINSHDRDATMFAGATVLLASIIMFMVEIARGEEGSPYYQLAALGGVSYVAAMVWLRVRR